MAEKELTNHDVTKPVTSTQSLEEYEEILKTYKKLNPSKYEAKEQNGEFDAYRVSLGGEPKGIPPTKEERAKAEKAKLKEEAKAEAKAELEAEAKEKEAEKAEKEAKKAEEKAKKEAEKNK